MRINELCSTLIDQDVTLNGWVMSVRSQKEVSFIKLNDGSNAAGVQLVTDKETNLSIGTSISVNGLVVVSPSPQQPFEIQVKTITVIGTVDNDYPLIKGKLPLEFLRTVAHLRMRTSTFGSVFRIKSAISHATHLFFEERGFLHLQPNIITRSECEGGAGAFSITEHPLSSHNNLPTVEEKEDKMNQHVCSLTDQHDWKRDHFDRPVFLTVSSQLQLEALACSLGPVYTTNKSFRSEHSNSSKHLSEFEHTEIEVPFTSLDELMDIGEDYIKYVGNYLLTKKMDDILNLDKFVSKGIRERVEAITNCTFTRITYDEAIRVLKEAKGITNPVVYGEDLCTEFENYLTNHFKGPVFVRDWVASIKSFYMKQLPEEKCSNFDLLMPYGVGELIGGSERETDLETMLGVMKKKGVSPEPLGFYTDLRKYGTVPHGGFGLGNQRLCMLFTGMTNIKDVTEFPVYYKHCEY